MLYVGEGPRGSNGACSTLQRILVTPSATHSQIGPLWCWFPSGWDCACSRPLWVSPTSSLVRLGVYPTATPTPTGVFNQRSESLFPPRWSPGLRGLPCSPPFLPVYLCANVELQGLLMVGLPAPFVPHSASLSPTMATEFLSPSAARLHPSYRSGQMFFFFFYFIFF